MALGGPTRKLDVAGAAYRWTVGAASLGQPLRAFVQDDRGVGARLVLVVPCDHEIGSRRGVRQRTTIGPADVARAIAEARAQGWAPGEPGPDRTLALDVDLPGDRTSYLVNPEPLLVPCANWAPKVAGIAVERFPAAAEPELVVHVSSSGFTAIVLVDATLGRLWFEDGPRGLADRAPPLPHLLRAGTPEAPYHEIEQGGERLCWTRGEEVAAGIGPGHPRPGPSDSLVLETYFRARRVDLAAAWAIVLGHAHEERLRTGR
jgi:hypothetical protein